MDTAEVVLEAAKKFHDELKWDRNARYRSWEHCYLAFYYARSNANVDVDYLSLQLAFYLASWGMYRGSSFLLQKDYKIHIPVVEELLKEQYDPLLGILCSELKNSRNQKLLGTLTMFLREYYDMVRRSVKSEGTKNEVSDILITKILMGTLGCVPAYDRYFVSGLKHQKVAIGTYSTKSVMQLVEFYEKNADRFDELQKKMKVSDLHYPQMKILDMAFWQIGFDLDMHK